MQFFNFRAEQQNVTELTETVILNNFSSKTVSDTTFRHGPYVNYLLSLEVHNRLDFQRSPSFDLIWRGTSPSLAWPLRGLKNSLRSLRPISNVVLLPCRTKLIELNSTLARQYRDVWNQVVLLPFSTASFAVQHGRVARLSFKRRASAVPSSIHKL